MYCSNYIELAECKHTVRDCACYSQGDRHFDPLNRILKPKSMLNRHFANGWDCMQEW